MASHGLAVILFRDVYPLDDYEKIELLVNVVTALNVRLTDCAQKPEAIAPLFPHRVSLRHDPKRNYAANP